MDSILKKIYWTGLTGLLGLGHSPDENVKPQCARGAQDAFGETIHALCYYKIELAVCKFAMTIMVLFFRRRMVFS